MKRMLLAIAVAVVVLFVTGLLVAWVFAEQNPMIHDDEEPPTTMIEYGGTKLP